jgi:hypothetical protein
MYDNARVLRDDARAEREFTERLLSHMIDQATFIGFTRLEARQIVEEYRSALKDWESAR